LAALLTRRGSQLTAVEARAVARVLADGADLTRRILTPTSDGGATGQAAAHLTAALPGLQAVRTGQISTLTPPSPAVLTLAGQIGQRIAALTRLVDRLTGSETALNASALHPVVAPLALWAAQAAAAAQAVHDGLHAAAAAGRLLALTDDPETGRRTQRYLWGTLRPGVRHPVLTGAAAGAAGLTAARTALTDPSDAAARTGSTSAAARRAAITAGAPFSGLHAALAGRTPQELPGSPRPAYPFGIVTTTKHPCRGG
jgi:hypothetical protein